MGKGKSDADRIREDVDRIAELVAERLADRIDAAVLRAVTAHQCDCRHAWRPVQRIHPLGT